MNLKNGKWVYNAQGLSSARAYGEQHDPSVADKAISIQKKLGLYKDDDSNKEENMENKELNFSSDSEKDKDVIMGKDDSEKDMACGNKDMVETSEDDNYITHIIGCRCIVCQRKGPFRPCGNLFIASTPANSDSNSS